MTPTCNLILLICLCGREDKLSIRGTFHIMYELLVKADADFEILWLFCSFCPGQKEVLVMF